METGLRETASYTCHLGKAYAILVYWYVESLKACCLRRGNFRNKRIGLFTRFPPMIYKKEEEKS